MVEADYSHIIDGGTTVIRAGIKIAPLVAMGVGIGVGIAVLAIGIYFWLKRSGQNAP